MLASDACSKPPTITIESHDVHVDKMRRPRVK